MGVAIGNGRNHTPGSKRRQYSHDSHTNVQKHEEADPEFKGCENAEVVMWIVDCSQVISSSPQHPLL